MTMNRNDFCCTRKIYNDDDPLPILIDGSIRPIKYPVTRPRERRGEWRVEISEKGRLRD
jgi:hypothetical protein